ncbi:unnamed protein product [Acanthoscelides obtectus]|uniref:Uncharacterized protein n=1 Tax=Acanthoscelides obtectus TaxID=200917 RepID=A0A9P0KM42_ACAOB|nr:unnamed protein product [Acanthoscelides obtectus]CAK1631874.1 O-acetyl-ADP-ribose deacetylase 1 [Acanthoscelides obtectus]
MPWHTVWLKTCECLEVQQIAKVFLRKFERVHELRQSDPEVGEVLQITEEDTNRKIFYLVTKKASYQKPNYEDLWNALCSLREVLLAADLRKLAIPKLACGLDNLDWSIIRSMPEVVFRYTGIRFLLCCLDGYLLERVWIITSSRTPTAREGRRTDIDIHRQ